MKKGRIVLNFTDFGNREWKDRLHGGNADNKTPEDFNPVDVAIGTAVEREHSNNPDIATEIAIDHLSQSNSYYDQLIASGIADEEDAISLYDELKDDSDKEKARLDILKNMDIEDDDIDDEGENVDIDDYDKDDDIDDEGEEVDIDDEEEDDLGTDKADIDDENDELINDDYPEVKEKIIMNFKSFLNED